MPTLMRDHPAWQVTTTGAARVMRCGAVPWLLTWTTNAPCLVTTPLRESTTERPIVDRTSPITPTTAPLTALAPAFNALGTVLRVRNADLWDAIGTAIIRQVIRAGQARLMYRRFCEAHGEPVPTAHGTAYLFPEPATVVDLPEQAFADLGMAFKRPPLVAAAQAQLEYGEKWAALPPAELVHHIQTVPRIGPWTAGAAVADWAGDFALYPYADLAVRTWAKRAAPEVSWPDDEPTFGELWRHHAAHHLSSLTLLTLAWGGNHAGSQ
jgi:DNA-3-methyladenine glycosylase II